MNQLHILYSAFIMKHKKKERFEIILEPLQALLQLSLLSFCPIGTKLTIQNNLLYVQEPSWVQGLMRTYYNDGRDDVFFLFNVIHRFDKFYRHLNDGNKEEKRLFTLLKELSQKGLDNLIQTYSNSDKPALLHTLQMYKIMLDKPSDYSLADKPLEFSTDIEKNIDDVFIKITNLYTEHDLKIIYNTLCLINDNNSDYSTYIQGLNNILEPIHQKIRKWICDNIIF